MNGFTSIISENQQLNEISTQNLDDNRIRALKSLALLLLHEVEQIEQTNVISGKCLDNQEISLTDDVQNYEAELIRSALIQSKGHQGRAAQILGIKNNTLCAKIKRHGIKSFSSIDKMSVSVE